MKASNSKQINEEEQNSEDVEEVEGVSDSVLSKVKRNLKQPALTEILAKLKQFEKRS